MNWVVYINWWSLVVVCWRNSQRIGYVAFKSDYAIKRSYCAWLPIQIHWIPSGASIPKTLCCIPTRADHSASIRLRCKEGWRGLTFSSAKFLCARSCTCCGNASKVFQKSEEVKCFKALSPSLRPFLPWHWLSSVGTCQLWGLWQFARPIAHRLAQASNCAVSQNLAWATQGYGFQVRR